MTSMQYVRKRYPGAIALRARFGDKNVFCITVRVCVSASAGTTTYRDLSNRDGRLQWFEKADEAWVCAEAFIRKERGEETSDAVVLPFGRSDGTFRPTPDTQ